MDGERAEGQSTEEKGLGEKEKRETFGPLDIKRYRKDDGRALILYTCPERENA